ncbi:MAG: hypothetical protein H7287_13005 [Thermoleophilia bacterium]|nr:hypothetical protein [Thermoleophilia bacterium]
MTATALAVAPPLIKSEDSLKKAEGQAIVGAGGGLVIGGAVGGITHSIADKIKVTNPASKFGMLPKIGELTLGKGAFIGAAIAATALGVYSLAQSAVNDFAA